MSFFEDIAAALDAEGIESRVNDDTMFVPITAELEIQFVEIDPILPAANVYIAAADVDEDDEDFEAVLVSVVFSVEDALTTVNRHVATDQIVTLLSDLLLGTDERIADLDFYQSTDDPNLVIADVAENSEVRVLVDVHEDVPTAFVAFVSVDTSYEDLVDEAISEVWETDDDAELSEDDRARLFESIQEDVASQVSEILDLGSFADFDRLFDVLSLAADQAEDWEAQLTAFDEDEFEPEVYDIFAEELAEDDFDEDELDEDDDFEEDDLEEDELEDDELDEDELDIEVEELGDEDTKR
ncbi:hypothetical protein CKALI_04305 [Corynebacterium kalinowskii]|uniref:Uncharacterized protein n=1 Tax=Corynebacterium kalinowskii TaxID=2675216 RepID=A0A6B8VWT2_9CORY|nr:hypothetical protein [Corynebacterium kalinowskii]QGU01740.1 hypothetical protein CKALI_04305 [Corynebacterium kalinowskii]